MESEVTTAEEVEEEELFNCNKCVATIRNFPKGGGGGVFFFPVTLFLFLLLIPLIITLNQTSSKLYAATTLVEEENRQETTNSSCNLFSGQWILKGEKQQERSYYYENGSCPFITEKQNCFMHGRPDTDFLKWRWKPQDCELPLFDANHFFKIVRGKSMAFVGDSIGRNQLESLLCLLNAVARPEDISARFVPKEYMIYSKWWFYADYNFTITILWSPFLVKSSETYLHNTSFYNSESLYLDEADTNWASRIEKFDYVIFSGGQWFFRPITFYENGQVVGCQKCKNNTELDFFGYKKAFQTALRTLVNLKEFKGLAFLVTHSPNHFENGNWNEGGGCNRTQPFTNEEKWKVHPYGIETLHQIQVDEFIEAEKKAKEKGLNLKLRLIDVTDAMLMRPDGHPNKYGHALDKNVSVNDCVHWCMPGPVDTWNEILLYMMKLKW